MKSKSKFYFVTPANDTDHMVEDDLEGWRPRLIDDAPDVSGFKVTVGYSQIAVEVILDPPDLEPGETEATYDSGIGLAMYAPGQDKGWVEEQLNPSPSSWFGPTAAIIGNVTLDGIDYEVVAHYAED